MSNFHATMVLLQTNKEVMHGTGSVRVENTATGEEVKLFMENGKVTSVENLAYEQFLWIQLRYESLISHSNLRALIRSSKTQRDSLYKILKRQAGKNADIQITFQEYLLGAMDSVYTWEDVQAEWVMGDKNKYTSAEIIPLPLNQFNTIMHSRMQFKHERYTEWKFKNDAQFMNAEIKIEDTIKNIEAVTPSSNLEELMLSQVTFKVADIHKATGYSLTSIAVVLDELQDKVRLRIDNPHGFTMPTALSVGKDAEVYEYKSAFAGFQEPLDRNANLVKLPESRYDESNTIQVDAEELLEELKKNNTKAIPVQQETVEPTQPQLPLKRANATKEEPAVPAQAAENSTHQDDEGIHEEMPHNIKDLAQHLKNQIESQNLQRETLEAEIRSSNETITGLEARLKLELQKKEEKEQELTQMNSELNEANKVITDLFGK